MKTTLTSPRRIKRAPKPVEIIVSRKVEEPTKLSRHRVFWHSGDLGDVIYGLPAIKALGGGELVLGPIGSYPNPPREAMTLARAELLKPLIELQPYISAVRFSDSAPTWDVNLNSFRASHLIHTRSDPVRPFSLCEQQLEAQGLKRGDETVPWISLDWIEPTAWPIVIHRSARYHNPKFPWRGLVSKYRDEMIFVGLPTEHEEFCREFGPVRFIKVRHMLDTARLIAGAKLFIGNQSCPYAIAEGLKQNSIQETYEPVRDCLFNRPNARFSARDEVDLDFISECLDKTPKPTPKITVDRPILPACIFMGRNGFETVGRLVDYCAKLDGTEVHVLSSAEEKNYVQPEVGNFAFRYSADKMRGKPFIWLEPDCIPMRPGWAKALSDLYYSLKDIEFVWSSDSNPPGDMIGAIGVYGPNAAWIIPKALKPPGMAWGQHWDGWVLQHVPHLLHRTPMIQHSYGVYDENGRLSGLHEFPRDNHMIRKDAYLLHKDHRQSLLYPENRPTMLVQNLK